jgi:hypothetical protein
MKMEDVGNAQEAKQNTAGQKGFLQKIIRLWFAMRMLPQKDELSGFANLPSWSQDMKLAQRGSVVKSAWA